MDLLRKLIRKPSQALHIVGCIVTVLMMLHVTADVAMKHLFNLPIPNTLEIVAAYYMVTIIFVPVAYVTMREGHILVELFTRSASPRTIAAFDAIMGLFTTIFMIVVTWKTLEDAIRSTVEGDVWDAGAEFIIVWPSHWLLPLGFGLMLAYVILQFTDDLRAAITGRIPNRGDS